MRQYPGGIKRRVGKNFLVEIGKFNTKGTLEIIKYAYGLSVAEILIFALYAKSQGTKEQGHRGWHVVSNPRDG